MTIKILPARLANQIAAGEVVERPASVVKELVENSLDSGATRIDIDIEKGGSKLIRVRDNGKGIIKDELSLALSRHATSKIHTLDDLEAIMSLGFRGEALASVSSVSRLTLTSRTTTQEQAWAAYTEGRDMEVGLKPTAHPVGTSVEVLDLFFNTPARRKFLRTEKTEFTHIDELLKRIALSRIDVTINLKHNGKAVRQYRAAKNAVQTEKRVAAVCGAEFVRNMLAIELEHNGLRLHGWITSPKGARQQNDLQYCYVNGRMMRDKLINHAIRQSYANSLRPDQYASYVLFIEIDPHQVDVNVHPAKHEVRFHQARLVHDFIYQALADSLAQSAYIEEPKSTTSAYHIEQPNSIQNQVMDAIERTPAYPGREDYQSKSAKVLDSSEPSFNTTIPEKQSVESLSALENNNPNENRNRVVSKPIENKPIENKPSTKEIRAYRELLSTPKSSGKTEVIENNRGLETQPITIEQSKNNRDLTTLGKAFAVVNREYLLTQSNSGEVLVSLAKAEWYRVLGQLQTTKRALTEQPLLVPLSIKLSKEDLAVREKYADLLAQFAIKLKEKNGNSLMVMSVPQPLRQQNLQQVIPELLAYLNSQDALVSAGELANWLANQITVVKSDYTLSEAIQLLSELEQLWDAVLPLQDPEFVQIVNFDSTITLFANR